MGNKFLGYIYKGLGSALDAIFGFIISILEIIVGLLEGVKRIVASLAGILLVMLFLNPFALILIFNPIIISIFIVLVVVPFLGMQFINYLKYLKYMVTEYFYDRAKMHLSGEKIHYQTMGDYGRKYRQDEENARRREQEAWRRAQEERRRQQEREWQERFNQWYRYQQQQQGGYYNDYNHSGYRQSPFQDPTDAFVKKYKESAQILGVTDDADKYEIKLAYRKMAKKYHPDVNHEADATKKFQEINEAYEFLNDKNIERYKNMRKN
ncbi:MAG: DnaJ domain-containing protein [Tissierellia bacterium]|nr:DnaJ domain-containing protein [Tissierellia bacterium]